MNDERLDSPSGLGPDEQAALDALLAEPRLTDEEWDELHRVVLAAATAPLTSRRIRARQARPVTRRWRWLIPVVPLAAAATALVLLPEADSDPVLPPESAEAALLADVTDQEFHHLVSGEANAEALLLLAVEDREE